MHAKISKSPRASGLPIITHSPCGPHRIDSLIVGCKHGTCHDLLGQTECRQQELPHCSDKYRKEVNVNPGWAELQTYKLYIGSTGYRDG